MKPIGFLKAVIPSLLLLAAVETAFTPAAWADKGLQLTFQEQVQTVREEKKGDPKETKTDNVLTVTLWPSVFSVDDGKKTTFYDFNRRKIDILDKAKKTYEEDSLYFEIGYRTAEFQNRLFLQRTLKAAGQVTPEFQTFQLETLFGLRHPKEKTPDAIARKTGPGAWNFNAPTKELAAQVQLTETKIPTGLQKSWGHYLLYGCSLHPSVLEFLEKEGKLPKSLAFQRLNVGEATRVTLTLQKQEEVEGPDTSWEKSFKRTVESDSELWALAQKSLALTPPEEATRKATLDFVEKASKAGHNFDAALACLEFSLQTGGKMDETLRSVLPKLKGDRNWELFQQGLSTQSLEEAEAAIKALDSIDRKGLAKGYVIDIMLGDAYEAYQKDKEAIDCYLKALKANPLLAGPWKDLGDVYYDGYQMDLAWLCWDTARKIYPDHPLLKGVVEQEKGFVKDFPEYF